MENEDNNTPPISYRTKEHIDHLNLTISIPNEHKEKRQRSKKRSEVRMMALAPVATVRILGSSNADLQCRSY
jgi:fructose-1,6-bisphosphatase/inositol monophosphatase family enzyme